MTVTRSAASTMLMVRFTGLPRSTLSLAGIPTLLVDPSTPAVASVPMGVVAGPFAAITTLLGVAGLLKFVRPVPTGRALAALRLPSSTRFVRVLGATEVVVAAGALSIGGRLFSALVAVSYVAFTGFVVAALTRGTKVSSCGCFGQPETPATVTHVVLNACASAVAVAVALGPDSRLADTIGDQPLVGLPFVGFTALTTYLLYLALAVLPRTSRAALTR